MVLTAIETIATIFIVLSFIKIIFIISNKKAWLSFAESFYNSKLAPLLLIILASAVLYYLLGEITIIQIIAAMAFSSLLIALGLIQYRKETITLAKKIYAKKMTGTEILYIIFWVIIMLWASKEIFL